ncbi:MAG: hypothetical protein KYX66_23250 [Blastomonas fulva]|uniref:tyrosine-protein phosphatase n=1 Tax=Blastomonas fulva TaxID=1550728 RepID=UPI0024E20A2F|nr:CpsB/CapC family capsule biosynthesis tyrosine phosphatase [Blastomonas fulva]MDK2759643.1 hypothetical protein [Blastomonas fulva]
MIDLHSHLLPGLDDGAPDLSSALELARVAVKDGITHMLCTPHIHPGRHDNTIHSIATAHKIMVDGLREAAIPLSIGIGAEMRFDIDLIAGVRNETVPFIGSWRGRKVLLLEFPHEGIPSGAELLTRWLIERGVVPMIAHPERNKGILRAPRRLKAFIEQGCLLQVTAASVAGEFGKAARELSHALLHEDRITVLASDAHNLKYRPPVLSRGVQCAAHIVGDAKAQALVMYNPWEIASSLFT